ncbi:MAG: Uma2 family endonuclease [Bacteroidota bacterium]
MKSATQSIPEVLVYEMVDGVPIYYRNYRAAISGTLSIDEIMGSSKLQSLIVAELIFLLRSFFGDDYLVFTNELGLQFSKKSWRATDIAVIKSDKVDDLDNKYLSVAPEIVIEIDAKAELNELKNPLGYYQEKTEELLQFGVEKVIWIFTDTSKVMIAEKGQHWIISDWSQTIEVYAGLTLNVEEIINKRKKNG